MNVLLLASPDPGDVDMGLVWTITFVVLALCLAIIVPAAMFYHEVEDITNEQERKMQPHIHKSRQAAQRESERMADEQEIWEKGG